jgi:DNA-binding transcriptional LysR family regulator
MLIIVICSYCMKERCMRLESFDLNLLLVFEAIERERSVTRAANSLSLSQPAVSHALARLRELLKDQLFVRGPAGMVPTPRAAEMAGPVRQAVVQLRSALKFEVFDPATATDTFTIAMNNFAAIVVAAPLAASCAQRAPHLRLVVRPSGTLDTQALLERGVLDLVIREIDDGLRGRTQLLIEDRHVAVMRRNHPDAIGRLSVAAFAHSAHLKISSVDENTRFIDDRLAERRKSRTIPLEAPYLSAGAILAASDMVAVMAHSIAQELCSVRPLVWKDLPFETPPIRIGMMWPDLYDRKPSHKWLRGVVQELIPNIAAKS